MTGVRMHPALSLLCWALAIAGCLLVYVLIVALVMTLL